MRARMARRWVKKREGCSWKRLKVRDWGVRELIGPQRVAGAEHNQAPSAPCLHLNSQDNRRAAEIESTPQWEPLQIVWCGGKMSRRRSRGAGRILEDVIDCIPNYAQLPPFPAYWFASSFFICALHPLSLFLSLFYLFSSGIHWFERKRKGISSEAPSRFICLFIYREPAVQLFIWSGKTPLSKIVVQLLSLFGGSCANNVFGHFQIFTHDLIEYLNIYSSFLWRNEALANILLYPQTNYIFKNLFKMSISVPCLRFQITKWSLNYEID